MDLKKRIEKLEQERPLAPFQRPNFTQPRELTAEEFEALYAEAMAAEEKLRRENRSNSLT